MGGANNPATMDSVLNGPARVRPLVPTAMELFEGLEIAVVATDTDGVLTYWNARAALLLGWRPDQVIGRQLADFVEVDDQNDRLTSKNTGWPVQMAARRPDGASLTIKSTSSAIRNASGNILGTVAFLSAVPEADLDEGPADDHPGNGPPGDNSAKQPGASFGSQISIIIATDSLLIGEGLASLFASGSDVQVLGRARNCLELVNLCRKETPQAVIISIRAGDHSSLLTVTAARHLRTEYPELGIVLVSDCGTEFALELLRDGSSRLAYLLDDHLPSMDVILNSLAEVVAGQSVLDPTIVDYLIKHHRATIDELSDREARVLELMADGLSNRAIAEQLTMSVKSIEKCISAIFRNLELNDQSGVDRRVTATLSFQRARNERLEYEPHQEEHNP
jgi:PAS domain S-box-containing protein